MPHFRCLIGIYPLGTKIMFHPQFTHKQKPPLVWISQYPPRLYSAEWHHILHFLVSSHLSPVYATSQLIPSTMPINENKQKNYDANRQNILYKLWRFINLLKMILPHVFVPYCQLRGVQISRQM
jgi:hypothetical protein